MIVQNASPDNASSTGLEQKRYISIPINDMSYYQMVGAQSADQKMSVISKKLSTGQDSSQYLAGDPSSGKTLKKKNFRLVKLQERSSMISKSSRRTR